MGKDLSRNYREINVILNLLGDTYKSKIPNKMKELFNKGEDKNYSPEITIDDFFAGRYLPDTKSILSILYINYWSSVEEKNKYMDTLRKLDEKYNEEHKLVLNEIFPNKEEKNKKNEFISQENQVIEMKNNSVKAKTNLLDKIKELLKKK